jgi:hypothetical protein
MFILVRELDVIVLFDIDTLLMLCDCSCLSLSIFMLVGYSALNDVY